MLKNSPAKGKYLCPLTFILSLWLLVFLVSQFYCYMSSLGVHQIFARVEYQPGSLKIFSFHIDDASKTGLYAQDKIIAIDGKQIDEFLSGGNAEMADLLDPPAFNLAKTVYHWPLKAGQQMTLVSLKAQNLTVERGSINPDWFVTGDSSSVLVQIDLNKDEISKVAPIFLTLQLAISIIFWLSTLFLLFFGPSQLMTACFIFLFNLLGLFLLVQISGQTSRSDPLTFVIGMFCVCFLPVSFLFFGALFPYGRMAALGAGTRILLISSLIFETSLFGLTLLVNFVPDPSSVELLRSLTNWRLFSLVFFIILGLITLAVHFVKSTGEERLKIRVVVIAFLLVCTPPMLLTAGYVLLGFFFNWIFMLNLLCLPTVILPIIIVYSILKHNLFYVDQVLRHSLIYVVLTFIITAIYTITCGIISLLFSGSQNQAVFLAFLVVSLVIARVKTYSQKFIDRVFYNDELDYTSLVRKWTVLLYKNSLRLESLLDYMVNELVSDFSYDQFSVAFLEEEGHTNRTQLSEHLADNLLVDSGHKEGFLLTFISSRNQDTETATKKVTQNERSKNVLGLLLDWSKIDNLSVRTIFQPLFPGWFNSEQEIINLHSTSVYSKTAAQNSPAATLEILEPYQFFIPFSTQSHISGGLLIGHKLSGQLPPLQEQNTLVVISHQIGLALNIALRVQQELTMLQIIQSLCINQEDLRLDEHRKVAMELHDTVKQRLSYIDNCLASWLMEQESGEKKSIEPKEVQDFIRSLYNNNREVLSQIKCLIQGLNPQALPGGLVVNIRQLISKEARDHPEKVIIFTPQFNSSPLLLSFFTEEETTSIFRIVQEAVGNAIRHSEGNFLHVKLNIFNEVTNPLLEVVIEDNGKGFNIVPSNLNQLILEKHFGLLQMRERTKMLGGKFHLASNSDGTKILCIIPINKDRSLFPNSSVNEALIDQILSPYLTEAWS